jgi:TetR/AcrR family transcriptional regulator
MPAPPKTTKKRKESTKAPMPGEPAAWAERAAEQSPQLRRSRDRGVEQAMAIVAAARRLIDDKGPKFTTQELIREAGIALQTFYRYFPSKDYLLLAVIENVIDESCAVFWEQAQTLDDPLDRLRWYVTATVRGQIASGQGPSFITAEHFRLQTILPAEVSRATQHYTDLLLGGIHDAMESGQVDPPDPGYAAWLLTQLTMAVFHHYDCAGLDEPVDQVADRLWMFCLGALNGSNVRERSPKSSFRASGARTRRQNGSDGRK